MEYQDFHMHGGVVEDVQVNGDLHMHGGVIERLTVRGDCQQFGGIVERNIHLMDANAMSEQQPKVIYRDREKIVYRDRVVTQYRTRQETQQTINDLQQQIERERRRADELEARNVTLQEELLKKESQQSDNVLVRRIDSLQRELAKERKAHIEELKDMRWRIDTLLDEVNNRHRRIYEDETEGHYIGVTDDSLDVLFTLINEYPIAYDCDLAEEYGISLTTLKYIAKVLRLAKSPEQRREARERLQRKGLDLIERRGGDQTKGKRKTKTKRKK